jgi:pimeloyl-ACP methyl ester carboxylesterase
MDKSNISSQSLHYIFLPGLGCDRNMFDEVVNNLKIPKTQIHQYDFGKYGTDYTIYNSAEQIYQKLVNQGIEKANLIFVSYSIGVFGLAQLCKSNKVKIEKILLFSPPIISKGSKYPLMIRIFVNFIIKTPGIELIQRTIFRMMTKMPGFVLFWDIIGVKYTNNSKIFVDFLVKTPLKSMMKAFDDLLRFDFAPYLESYTIPTIIIRGKKDRIIKKFKGHVHDELFKNSETIWVEANHDIPEDYPKLTAEIIQNNQ